MAKKKSKQTKVKKKRWAEIYAKKFNNVKLGETYVEDEKLAINKTLKTSLMNVNQDVKSQNMNVSFKITEFKDGKLWAEFIGYEMINAAVKRIVRKGKDKITDSFVVKSKEGKLVRVKPLLLTHHNTYNSVGTSLKNLIKVEFIKLFQTKNFDEIINDIINYKLQKEMKNKLKKIYPLRNFDIQKLKIVNKGTPLKLVENN